MKTFDFTDSPERVLRTPGVPDDTLITAPLKNLCLFLLGTDAQEAWGIVLQPWHLTHFLVFFRSQGKWEHKLFPCFFKINYSNSCVLSYWDSRWKCLKKERKWLFCYPASWVWYGCQWRSCKRQGVKWKFWKTTRDNCGEGLPCWWGCASLVLLINFWLRRGIFLLLLTNGFMCTTELGV